MDIRAFPLWTALVSPLKTDFTLDRIGLSRLLDEQQQANTGLLLLGSTAESLNLGPLLKKNILEYCLAYGPKLPIMVGVPGHDLAATLSWLDYLESLPIHAYLMVTPIYARAGDHGQYHWFKTLMDRVSRPVMLYNVPKRCGSSLSLSAVRRLQDHPNYWGIKDASGSLTDFYAYVDASFNKPVYCGDDPLFPDFAKAKSSGLISVASNVWPQGVKLFVAQCLANSLSHQALWQDAFDQLFKASNPIAVKRLLFEEKRIGYKTMMPPLSDEDFVNCDALIDVSNKINQWTQNAI